MNATVIRRLVLAAIAVVITITSSIVLAQTEEDRPTVRRGGDLAFRFGGCGFVGLVAMPQVQRELKLSDAEAAAIMKSLEALRPQIAAVDANLERSARLREVRKQTEEAHRKVEEKLKSTLSETQWRRLNELQLQREGSPAIARPEIVEKLKLSEEQRKQIKELTDQLFAPRGEIVDGVIKPDSGREDFDAARENREKTLSDILAVLTPDQKVAWEAMQGAKFDFPRRSSSRPPAGGVFGLLVAMSEVQHDLKLTEDDVARIDQLLQKSPLPNGGLVPSYRGLSPEEREKRLVEFGEQMKEGYQKIDEKLKSALSPEQYQRFHEIKLQDEGVSSWDRPEIAATLKLSVDQQEKIKRLIAEQRTRFGLREELRTIPDRDAGGAHSRSKIRVGNSARGEVQVS